MFIPARMRVIRLLLVSLVFCLSCVCVSSWAELGERESLEVKREELRKNFPVIRGFLDAAFTEGIWNSNSPDFDKFLSKFLSTYDYRTSPNKFDKRYTAGDYRWIEEYYFRTDGFPKAGVINKWQSEITVGISEPRYSEKDIEFEDDPSWGVIERIVNSVAPELSRVTGLPIRFVKKTTNEHTAAIRLMSVFSDKTDRGGRISAYPHWDLFTREHELWGAVEFLDERLDGYLLPKTDNTIGMAICKVNVSDNHAYIGRDVTACLLRSLGLTGKANFNQDTPLTSGENANPKLPQDGLNLLRLLYCPEIKPGMDKYQAIDVFMKNKTCIARIKH